MKARDVPLVLAIGDSLTAGYCLEPAGSFAARIEAKLQTSRPGAIVQNAGVSGDTTEGALRRLPALLSQLTLQPKLAIVELGANDLLRGIPPARTSANLDAILLELGRCSIPVLLATFEVPGFFGPLATSYDGIYATLAAKHGVAAAPFFPPGVLGRPDLVLADRLHPNARAIDLVANAFLPAVLIALERAQSEAA